MMELSHEAEVAEVKGNIYQILSNIYMQVPDSNFPDVLNEEILPFLLFAKSFALKEKWPKDINDGINLIEEYVGGIKERNGEEGAEDLAVEFTRLFRGVKLGYGPPPPYESIYKKSEHVMSEVSSKVQERYKKAGLAVIKELQGEPPDHISFELYFLSYLYKKESENLRKDDEDNAAVYRVQRNEFLQEHVIKWIPLFCERILNESENDLYRGIAMLTRGLIRSEH